MFWILILTSIAASYVAGVLLAKKPEDAAPDDSDPFGSPQAKPSSPVPVMYGTRRLRGLNVLWYGEVSWRRVENKGQTVGYYYYTAFQLGVCLGFSNMRLRGAFLGEYQFVEAIIPAGSQVDFFNHTLMGGDYGGGGVCGTLAFNDGINIPTVHPKMVNAYGVANVPHNNYLAHVNLWGDCHYSRGGMMIGTSKQVRPVSVIIENLMFKGGIGEAPYNNGVDINPVVVIRNILLEEPRFLLLSGDEVDLAALNTAEQTLWDEGLLFSPIFSRAKPVEKMLESILNFIDGVLYTDPLTGKLTLTLLRETAVSGNEVVLDNSNITKIVKNKFADTSNLINEVKLTFTDRNHNYEDRTITSQDLAGFLDNGGVFNTQTVDYPSICDIVVARKICDRDLMQLANPIDSITLDTNRSLSQSRIGDSVIINLPDIGISNKFYRISEIDYGSLDKGTMRVSLISDVYTSSIQLYENEATGDFVEIAGNSPVSEITNTTYIEVPARLLSDMLNDPVAELPLSWAVWPILDITDSNNYSCDLYLDKTGGNLGYELQGTALSTIPKATLIQDYLLTDTSLSGDNTHTNLRISLPTQMIAADENPMTNSELLATQKYFALVGGEWIAFAGLFEVSSGVYSLDRIYRGLYDTPPIEHLTGTEVLFVSEASIVSDYPLLLSDTTDIDIKLDPIGYEGSLGVVNIVNFDTVISTDNINKPLPVGNLTFNYYRYFTGETRIVNDLIVRWSHRSRTSTTHLSHQTSGDDVKDPNVTYTVEVYESDGTTLIHSVTGLDPVPTQFPYTRAQELIDHGTNDSVLIFKIISVDSVTGDCTNPRIETVPMGGYGVYYDGQYNN